jgi:hypothetical protein
MFGTKLALVSPDLDHTVGFDEVLHLTELP